MREAHALISYKAAEERHWDEAEEDDEEDRPTDDPLRLWAAGGGKARVMTGREQRRTSKLVIFYLKYQIKSMQSWDREDDNSHFLFGRFV